MSSGRGLDKQIFNLIMIALLVLAVPQIIRFLYFNDVIPGTEPYYHIKMANTVKQGIPSYEDLTVNKRPYQINPFHFLLAVIPINIAKRLPVLFGIVSLFLFYLILKKLGVEQKLIFAICLILVISPVYVYSFTVLDQWFFSIFISLLACYMILLKKPIYYALSLPLFLILMAFGIVESIIALVILLLFYIDKKDKRIFPFFVFLLITGVVYWSKLFYYQGIYISLFVPQNLIQNFISDLGAQTGLGIFTVLLFPLGFALAWRKKKQFFTTYIILIVLILLSFFYKESLFYLNFVFSAFAASAFIRLLEMKWQVRVIKNLTILILVYGLIFSYVSYSSRLVKSTPDLTIVDSLKFLEQNSKENDVIFSHWKRGFWIEAIANRKVVMDSKTRDNEIYFDVNQTLYSRNLKSTKKILSRYNVSYIYIDSRMAGETWTKKEQGLMFLFRNNETFKRIYNESGVQIWKFLR